MPTQINHYTFDRIIKDDLGCYWGYKGENFCEVFPWSEEPLSFEETEDGLIQSGYAKCDAPGTDIFVVEESSWKDLHLAGQL